MTSQTAAPSSTVPQPTACGGGPFVQCIAFVADVDDPRPALAPPAPDGVRAVVVGTRSVEMLAEAAGPPADLTLLVLPTPAADAAGPSAETLAWVEAGGPVQLISLHGAVVAWTTGRAALLVEPARVDAVRAAVVDFFLIERELHAIEAHVVAGWPDVEADAPLAFEFVDRDADRRQALGERFRRMIALRGRLARLAPHLDRPPLHPPTLASQVGERLRERCRMAERAGFLDGQLEVQERVYELCGQRSSDWALARRSITLEWVIIVLLAFEAVLMLVDLLASGRT